MVVIENFKKKDARPHEILGYSTKRIERLTFCIHLNLRRAFRYYIRNSYSLTQRKYLSAVNVLSAHVGIWNSCRNTYDDNGNRSESVWSAKRQKLYELCQTERVRSASSI